MYFYKNHSFNLSKFVPSFSNPEGNLYVCTKCKLTIVTKDKKNIIDELHIYDMWHSIDNFDSNLSYLNKTCEQIQDEVKIKEIIKNIIE